ncbi:MAG: hypothetical protein JSS02_19025 [Planctomycetes bacterium]|nr:hypothetical protein [Planctomycetota bacterium]
MSQAYTPGLKVTERTLLRRRRSLPIKGRVLVQMGDRVAARDIIAQTDLPGPIVPVNVANLLSIPPREVAAAMQVAVGSRVSAGQVIARSKGLFGWFQKECRAPVDGTVETVSAVTGQVMLRGAPLPVQLPAFLAGQVVQIVPEEGATIEAECSFIQGIFGIGSEAFGPIHLAGTRADQTVTEEFVTSAHRGAVLVGGGRVTAGALARAVSVGVSAVVTGGIDDQDLRDFLGYDLGVATTGAETAGLTLIITEGFGDIAMASRTFDLLASRENCDAAVNGATQIRAGVLRPEVIIPWPVGVAGGHAAAPRVAVESPAAHVLRAGIPVRIIRDPYFGMIGTVVSLPPEPRILGSGSKARVLEVRLPQGEQVLLPRANVELIEE